MKWLLCLFAAVTTLLTGYWLGASSAQHTPKPTQELSKYAEEKITAGNGQHTYTEPRLSSNQTLSRSNNANNEDNSITLKDKFLQHLASHNYTPAVALLANTLDSPSHTLSALKSHYIAHTDKLLTQPNNNRIQIDEAIQTYLNYFYDDTEMLLLLAKQHVYLNNFYEMLNTVQLAKNYAYTNEKEKIVNSAYVDFISYTDQLLSEQEQSQTLISIYLHSDDTGLLREQDALRLVELYVQQNEIYFAADYAERLAGKQQWQKQLSELLPQIATPSNTKETDMTDTRTTIPLLKISDQFVITTELSGNSTKLLIDTGASITTLSKKYFESIKRQSDFSYQQKQIFLTANGETTGEIYTVDTFQIGQYLLEDLEIAVIDFSTSQHSSGLLGMNVLRRFKFEIDQINSLLALEEISP